MAIFAKPDEEAQSAMIPVSPVAP